MMNNILVTGGCGFIGSNFINYLLQKYDDINVINVDALTYASDESSLSGYSNDPRYKFEKGNILNTDFIDQIFQKYKINDVVHFAAESHVDNSIENPSIFVKTNVLGTFNLLNSALKLWHKKPFVPNNEFASSKFHHVSTDEVFGSLGENGFFVEETPYAPNSPYSASKAGSDFLVRSYNQTYGLNTSTSNCSNNYGPHQHPEKLIPKIIHNALNGIEIPVFGDGKNVRDWLYVLDHCEAIDLILKRSKSGAYYNIGGNCEMTNIDIVNLICNILNEKVPSQKPYNSLIKFVEDRLGHDERYAIDATKIQNELNWSPKFIFKDAIDETIDWYIKKLVK